MFFEHGLLRCSDNNVYFFFVIFGALGTSFLRGEKSLAFNHEENRRDLRPQVSKGNKKNIMKDCTLIDHPLYICMS